MNLHSHSLYHPQIWFNKHFMCIVFDLGCWWLLSLSILLTLWDEKGMGSTYVRRGNMCECLILICVNYFLCCGSELLHQTGFIFYQDGSFLKHVLEIRLGMFYRAKCKINLPRRYFTAKESSDMQCLRYAPLYSHISYCIPTGLFWIKKVGLNIWSFLFGINELPLWSSVWLFY